MPLESFTTFPLAVGAITVGQIVGVGIVFLLVATFAWGAWRLRDRFGILGEFLLFVRERKLLWLLPLLIVFLVVGLFAVITTYTPLGAAIYTLF